MRGSRLKPDLRPFGPCYEEHLRRILIERSGGETKVEPFLEIQRILCLKP
jgi:hypothetical protein